MSIQILIDMNLSPDWVDELANHRWTSTHWSGIGDPRATDREIMDWARNNNQVVFTHDLDFGTMLALTHASGPSLIQVRGQNILPVRSKTQSQSNPEPA
jgi:predicted nuclease of predicted toxin-antitoxin system